MTQAYDLLIIGGGPAGLTAALYAGRAGRRVLVLERAVCGGQILNAPLVENYPGRPNVSGVDLMSDLYTQAEEFGAEIRYEEAADLICDAPGHCRVRTASGTEYTARAVIIAAGRKNRPLGLPDEERLTGRGISYCAACDGGFYRGKKAAVVGGGNTALHDALYLADLCEQVTLIHRRNTFRGEEHTLNLLRKRDNVRFCTPAVVTALHGTDFLSGITVSRDGAEEDLPVDGLFVAVGQLPQNDWLAPRLTLREGYIPAGEDCRTSIPGVFAAGDCRTKEIFQLSTAAADGTVAAMNALDFLTRQGL